MSHCKCFGFISFVHVLDGVQMKFEHKLEPRNEERPMKDIKEIMKIH